MTFIRDYSSEADKHCLLKVADLQAKEFAVWSDHLKKADPQAALRKGQEEITKLDAESVQKQFQADIYKLSHDIASFSQFIDQQNKEKRTAQLAKVTHVRAENKRGSAAVLEFMNQNCKHVLGLYKNMGDLEDIKKAQLETTFS